MVMGGGEWQSVHGDLIATGLPLSPHIRKLDDSWPALLDKEGVAEDSRKSMCLWVGGKRRILCRAQAFLPPFRFLFPRCSMLDMAITYSRKDWASKVGRSADEKAWGELGGRTEGTGIKALPSYPGTRAYDW